MYNIHRGWGRRLRLKKLAQYIQLMDKAIESEGGPDKLNDRQLKWVYYLHFSSIIEYVFIIKIFK